MAEHTNIEWCDATVNWWVGCTQISPGCDACYAKRIAAPFWGQKWGPGVPLQRFEGALETLKALDRKAQRLGRKLVVFHNSVSDMFDKDAPDAWRMDAFEGMAQTPNLIHLVLTKRIGNVGPYLQRDSLAFDLIGEGCVWLGITVCNQPEADRDITKLLAVPAAKRFLSMEPLLGPVDLTGEFLTSKFGFYPFRALEGEYRTHLVDLLDWVIVGGESGPGARPLHPDWVRSLRDQCQAARVPFMFKQWGGWLPAKEGRSITGRVLVLEGAAPFSKNPKWHGFEDGQQVARVGKKAAGRLLDGVEHNGRPE
ncbi:phage Gp37/Gp68 family protein [Hydrogenophaga electricum]|uniref:Phage Gp37/Gp68 family protein n=1 Tax=Hydrogenophaga electricum TaxID=1230953 RepID=A0ABQ6C066_9BURK|nr:phage Gp37/Gp68 family protein [Hydrogenophaga electricum]GLS13637.1 hypothetical protein GCM10007935_10670 [Hydrogenophaga electricum]